MRSAARSAPRWRRPAWITAVRVLAGVPSGLALITVDATGENSITVAPGADGLARRPEAAATTAAPCDALSCPPRSRYRSWPPRSTWRGPRT